MAIRCHLGCGRLPGTTPTDWNVHYKSAHGPERPDLTGPGQDWHTRAIDAVTRLANLGGQFTFYDVAQLAGDPINPRAQWGAFAQEIEHIGIAYPSGYQQSNRPESRGSAVRQWRAGRHPSKENAA